MALCDWTFLACNEHATLYVLVPSGLKVHFHACWPVQYSWCVRTRKTLPLRLLETTFVIFSSYFLHVIKIVVKKKFFFYLCVFIKMYKKMQIKLVFLSRRRRVFNEAEQTVTGWGFGVTPWIFPFHFRRLCIFSMNLITWFGSTPLAQCPPYLKWEPMIIPFASR